jgi:phosphoserine aminotransferase
MNVPFVLSNGSLDKLFLEKSYNANLLTLKGHKAVGGMRASIYNAMPLDGVISLIEFMSDFEKQYG